MFEHSDNFLQKNTYSVINVKQQLIIYVWDSIIVNIILNRMLGKVIFQLEQRVEPFAIACENGYFMMKYGEGGFVLCGHGFEFRRVKRYEPMREGLTTIPTYQPPDPLAAISRPG
jgi:hypothetical protein